MTPIWFAFAAALAAFLVWRRKKLEPTLLIGGAIVVVGAVVYGTGVVHLPKVDQVLKDIGGALGPYTYLLVAVMAFLETGAFVGLIAPGETVILIGGVVAGQGEIDIVVLIAIVWACAVGGDLTSFYLGRRLGRSFLVRNGPKVQISEQRIEQVEEFFLKHGGKATFLGRFVGLVRAVAPFLAGSSGMALRRFVPYDVLGAGLWGTTFAVLGYVFWHSIDQVLAIAKKGSLALATTIVLVAALVAAVRWVREPENRRRGAKWLRERAEQPGPLRPPARVALGVLRRSRRPARFVYNRVTPGDLGLELTTLLTLAAVGGFIFFGYLAVLGGTRLTPGDRRGLQWSDDLRVHWLDQAAKLVTGLGSLPVAGGALVLVALVLLVRREVLEGIALLCGLGLTFAAVHVFKAAEGRARPPDSLVSTSGSAYPSGHAAYAMAWIAIAVALRRVLPGIGSKAAFTVAAIVVAAAIGATRIYLHAHWFSDVAGGWALATLCFALCAMGALVVGHLRHNPRSE